MNRKERRTLTQQERKDVNNHVIALQQQLNKKLADVDNQVLVYGKNVASMVITAQIMPIIRDVLAFDLNVDEERIALFEQKFAERKDIRMAHLTLSKIEKDAKVMQEEIESKETQEPTVAE